MNIYIHGIPRSGSTLVWQITKCLFPDVHKTHPEEKEAPPGKYILTVRHPFDILSSRFRVRLSRSPAHSTEEMKSAFSDELYQCERFFINFKKDFPRDLPCSERPAVILFYEQFWNDYELIFMTLEMFFCITIPPFKQKALREDFSLNENLKRASLLPSFNEVDEKTNIHGDHIGLVVPGHWKYSIPPWGMELMKERLTPICKEWNYAID